MFLKRKENNMKVKIIAEMTSEERDNLMNHYNGWTIEEIVFDRVAPNDDYQDIEVHIVD